MAKNGAIIGVSHHNGWAALVTVAGDGRLLDRRRIELADAELPKQPHHSEGQRIALERAVELVERVRVSANEHAAIGLAAVAASVHLPIRGIALRACPRLPATVAERIRNYWAQCNADSVMYREALAAAAEARGWFVHWYDKRQVLDSACEALRVDSLDDRFVAARKALGPPWGNDQRIAMAAAIVAGARGAGT